MEYEKPVQPPPAIVISVESFGGQFGLAPNKLDRVVEARRLALQQIDQFVVGLNVGNKDSSPGFFKAENELVFKVDRASSWKTVAAAALKLPDERLLTPGAIDALIAANQKSHPEAAAGFSELKASLASGGPVAVAPTGSSFALKSAEGVRFEFLQNAALIEMLNALPESLLNDNGKKNRNEILVLAGRIALHKDAQVLGLEIERDNAILTLRAEEGTLKIMEGLNPRLETLAAVVKRAQSVNMPEVQLKSIERIAEKAKDQSIETAVDVSQRAALIAEMRGDGAKAIQYLSSAKKFISQISDPVKREAELAETAEQAKLLLTRTASAELVKGTAPETFRKNVEMFFTGPEVDAVMAQSLLRAAQLNRNQQMLKGVNDSRDEYGKNSYKQAAELYAKALGGLGYGGPAVNLSKQDRAIAYEASNFLIERALTEGRVADVQPLLQFRLKGLPGATEVESRRQDDGLKVRLARAVFEEPAKYGSEVTAFLGLKDTSNKKETKAVLLEFVRGRMSALGDEQKELAARNAPVAEQRAVAQQQSDAQVALSRMLVHGVVSDRGNAAEKLGYYRQLNELNEVILNGEKELIQKLRADVATFESALAGNPAQAGVFQDRIEVLKGEIKGRELSAAMLIVQQAEVALHGDHPDLTREAKALIEKAEEFGGSHPGIATLTKKFREQNEHGKLRAALEEFISEVNKDYPPYVLGAMIAAGILGAAAGYSTWKNNKGALYGFMAASCLTLAGTKAYYAIQGADQIQAAYQTGFSPHSPTQDVLNVLYLAADVAQALPLIPAAIGLLALSRMKRKDEIITEINQTEDPEMVKGYLGHTLELLKRAGKEGVEFGWAAMSLLNPKSATFWLLAVTVGTAGFQVLGSDLPDAIKDEQMNRLALELMQTLAIAIIYDRIAANLANGDKKNPRDAAKDAVAVLNDSPPPPPDPATAPAEKKDEDKGEHPEAPPGAVPAG